VVPSFSAAEAAQRIADRLESSGLPYAIGGALALGVAGIPRGTIDVDVNVFVEEERIPFVIGVLSDLGIELDHDYVRRWLVDMMGGDDERVLRWDDIVRRFATSSRAP